MLAKNRKQFISDSRVQSNLYYNDDNDAIECEIMNFYAADEFIANYCTFKSYLVWLFEWQNVERKLHELELVRAGGGFENKANQSRVMLAIK